MYGAQSKAEVGCIVPDGVQLRCGFNGGRVLETIHQLKMPGQYLSISP